MYFCASMKATNAPNIPCNLDDIAFHNLKAHSSFYWIAVFPRVSIQNSQQQNKPHRHTEKLNIVACQNQNAASTKKNLDVKHTYFK